MKILSAFVGFRMRNSVNRILNELKREGVLDIRQQKIVILDNERIEEFIGRPVVENCLAGALHTKDAWQRFCFWAVPRNIFRRDGPSLCDRFACLGLGPRKPNTSPRIASYTSRLFLHALYAFGIVSHS